MVWFKKSFIFKQIQNVLFRWVMWPAGLLLIRIQIPVKEIPLKLIKGKYTRYIHWRLIIFSIKKVRNKNFSRLFIIWKCLLLFTIRYSIGIHRTICQRYHRAILWLMQWKIPVDILFWVVFWSLKRYRGVSKQIISG